MAQSIDRVIDLEIDLAATSAEAEDLSLPLLVGEASEFPVGFTDVQRIKTYFDLASIASDGFETTSKIYKLAESMFAQGTLNQVAIGKKISTDASYKDAITKISEKNNDWYGLTITSRVKADILSACDFAESNSKLGSFASSDEEIIDSNSTTDVASEMKKKAYSNSYITYHEEADDEYIDGASLAGLLGSDAGNYSLAYKTLAGITVDNPSSTAINTLETKKCNYYTPLAKVNAFFWGTTPAGQMVALTRDLFWFKRQIQLAEINKFFNNKTIKLNPRGIAIIESGIITVCDQAIKQQVMRSATKKEIATDLGITEDKVEGYRADFGYALVMPDITNPMNFESSTKTLKNVEFTGKIADEIHRLSLKFRLSI